ncbi:ABC transporter substrate-binding protein [Evtepia sp.]|uniref:ABC transporter substrate-binding protein n=1 Tax=Evtepia sp. TaxID=2773933 RepID=UPI002A837B1D|nr:ABC transporter substrate-binding protein [Evtepia sp.]MDY4429687.1 ABC transporter substrate-binding protein [Evtepia sp.]
MKKILALLLAGCMAFALAACGTPAEPADDGGEDTAAAGDTVVIGVYEPLSGDNGAGGKQEVLGMQYANSVAPTVEIDGKTYNVKLEIADNESSNDKAVSAANTLISKTPSIILGSYGSGVSIAASDTFEQAGIPAMGVTCTNPQVTEGNSHYFRICFLDPFQGTVLANFAKDELGANTVYCLGQLGNDYDQGLLKYFQQAAEEMGMTVITDSFPEGTSDFNSYLTTAKNKGAEVIFAPTSISYAQLIVEQASAQGITMPLLASDTWDSNVILSAAQGKDLSIYVTTFYAEGGNPEFEQGFKEWINADSTNLSNNGGDDTIAAVSVMGYDAYFVALEALKAAGSIDPGAVMEALPGVTYSGVSGDISFNEIGDANRTTAFVKTANVSENVWDFVAVQGVE